jgi:hypothetical protein
MDPHLNSLFDNSINSAEFVNKILTLPHEQIIKIYMKLTTLKHSISKNMQKEIEAKYSIIEKSFEENYETKNNYEAINN